MVTTTASNRYVLMSLLGAFLPFFGVIWLTIGQTGGYYEYPLDDPYIHLAMSEQIANGGYGVNAGEYAHGWRVARGDGARSTSAGRHDGRLRADPLR